MGTKTMKIAATSRNFAFMLAAGLVVCTASKSVSAQEVVVTGPLAGAPAAHRLRLYREGRFELQPNVTFSLLDEFQHEILIGATLNYNLSDSFALGVWGSFGAVKMDTALTEHIQTQINARQCGGIAPADVGNANYLDCRLSKVNLGSTFSKQLGTIDWMAVPQLTFTPFRGKIAFFQSLFVDSDLHFFVGPAFLGVSERKDCNSTANCATSSGFATASRFTYSVAFGLGLSFFTHKWGALAVDWRAVPFSRNTGGFDTAGSGPNKAFPDNTISSEDRQFRFNQFVSIGYSVFLPFDLRVSE